MDRRDFLKTATTAAGVAATEQLLNPMLSAADKTPGAGEMIYRTLGRTGERVSAIGLGGFHIGQPSLTDTTGGEHDQGLLGWGCYVTGAWNYV